MNAFNNITVTIGRYRWTICALVFFATTVNYLDRNVLGLLKQTLSDAGVFGDDKGQQELNYSTVVICFQLAYALGMLAAGRFIDWVGTKAGYAYALIGWSLAAIGHAFGHHTWSFGFWRAALGVTEAGNFPAANKTIAEWFPKKERALATGLYNSGANVGAIVAPLSVPYIASAWGWEWAFILTGAVGLLWLVFWYLLYASPTAKLQSNHLKQAEYDYIHSDADEQAAAAEHSKKEPKNTNWITRVMSLRGRSYRGEFWGILVLTSIVVYLAIWALLAADDRLRYVGVVFVLISVPSGIIALIAAWVFTAVSVRRWHDVGKSGWLAALNFVPLVNIVAILFLGTFKGNASQNSYGEVHPPTLLDFRQTWAFAFGKFLTDPIWWFYLFWLPAFLTGENARKLSDYMTANPNFIGGQDHVPGVISWPFALAFVYTIATVGSIFGGWLPKKLMHSGMDANKARKRAMFIFALFPLAVLLASRLGAINTWYAVGAIAIACAAHQAWSANIFTTVSDMFPKWSVASVTGIGGMAGGLGGILISRAAGVLLKHYTDMGKPEVGYGILFMICGSAYLIAWIVMHLLAPTFKKIELNHN